MQPRCSVFVLVKEHSFLFSSVQVFLLSKMFFLRNLEYNYVEIFFFQKSSFMHITYEGNYWQKSLHSDHDQPRWFVPCSRKHSALFTTDKYFRFLSLLCCFIVCCFWKKNKKPFKHLQHWVANLRSHFACLHCQEIA